MKRSTTLLLTYLIILVLITITINGNALVLVNKKESFDGYTLYSPEFSPYVFLIDNTGCIVHQWNTHHLQGLPVYLLENGSLLRGDAPHVSKDFFLGGVTGRVSMYHWNGSLLWEFTYANNQHLLHNDIEPLPNGNILMNAWEKINNTNAIKAGCNPALIGSNDVWSDVIIEVEPTFPKGGNIVWEWHTWDHLIQDYDKSKKNYGNISDHPELIDINFNGTRRAAPNNALDLFHINSVEYIQEFDQILLNARNLNEIWIIDHTTNTTEAKQHTGGAYNKGGDLLYRWGNPQVYHRGTEENKQLFMQHDARWIPAKKDNNKQCSITIFNNGYQRPGMDYSSVLEIKPPITPNGTYSLQKNESYDPKKPVWTYKAPWKPMMYSPFISGAQRLPNNNTLICSGDNGIFLEVTPDKNIVWMNINLRPLPMINNVFKTQSYPANYPGLQQLQNI
jgi:hypothetical protein